MTDWAFCNSASRAKCELRIRERTGTALPNSISIYYLTELQFERPKDQESPKVASSRRWALVSNVTNSSVVDKRASFDRITTSRESNANCHKKRLHCPSITLAVADFVLATRGQTLCTHHSARRTQQVEIADTRYGARKATEKDAADSHVLHIMSPWCWCHTCAVIKSSVQYLWKRK
jgi:hypothetical protein